MRDPYGRRVFLLSLALAAAVAFARSLGLWWAAGAALAGSALVSSSLVANLARVRARIAQLARDAAGEDPEDRSLETASLETLADRLELARRSLAEAHRKAEKERDDVLGILEATSEGILVLGEGHRVEMLNATARNLLSPSIDPLGRRLEEVIRQRELLEFASELSGEGRAKARTLDLPVGSEKRVVGLSGARVPGDSNQSRSVIVLRDLSELAHLESVRTDFVANVTHEMRSPLSSILGYAELLEEDPGLDSSQRDATGRIVRNARRLDAIIRDLIELSRLEHGAGPVLSETDVPELLRGIVDAYRESAERKQIALEVRIFKSVGRLRLDPDLVHQALANLVENAIKYTNEGGWVQVRAKLVTEDGAQLLEIAVSDDGPGIPADHQMRIFERFYRVDSGRARAVGGTGLGLAIVKHACVLHGGRVELESSGEGSTFTLRIPIESPLA